MTDKKVYAEEKCKCGGNITIHYPDHIKCEKCGLVWWNLVTGVYNVPRRQTVEDLKPFLTN